MYLKGFHSCESIIQLVPAKRKPLLLMDPIVNEQYILLSFVFLDMFGIDFR